MTTDEPVHGHGGRRVTRRTFLAAASLAVTAVSCSDSSSSAPPTSRRGTTTQPPVTSAAPSTTIAPTTTAPPGPARFVVSGPTTGSRVALTFHTDGDLGMAAEILDIFSKRKLHFTSFVVGSWLAANPTWAARIRDGGHELANHTYTHPTFSSLSATAMRDEITKCRDLLTSLVGSGGRCFRPSGTADGTATPSATVLDVAGTNGYPIVLGFDVDPLDYDQPGADAVAQRTLAAVKAGSIISLHFNYRGTITALPTILDGLDKRNLAPVTASELLGFA